MNISADAILSYVLVAFGGFLVKYIWDALVKEHNEKESKAEKYDQQALHDHVESIVKEMCQDFKSSVEKTFNDFKTETSSEFKRYRDMYWEAVDDLKAVKEDFKVLKEQDIQFYKFQLINACKAYIAQGWMTQYQFDTLSDLHHIYNKLGGNAQGDSYYEKAIRLPIVKEDEQHQVDRTFDEIMVSAEDMKDLHHENKK